MVKELDFSVFETTKTDVIIENQKIENCRISGIQRKNFVFQKCQFHNVIFDSIFNGNKGQSLNIEDCEFEKCKFSDKFGGFSVFLTTFNNKFSECQFENIVYHGYMEQSEVIDNKFVNCTFRNIVILGDLTLSGMEICGGSIERFYYEGNSIYDNPITDLVIEDVVIRGSFKYNVFKNVTFKNVTIVGVDSKNEFIDCIDCYKYINNINP